MQIWIIALAVFAAFCLILVIQKMQRLAQQQDIEQKLKAQHTAYDPNQAQDSDRVIHLELESVQSRAKLLPSEMKTDIKKLLGFRKTHQDYVAGLASFLESLARSIRSGASLKSGLEETARFFAPLNAPSAPSTSFYSTNSSQALRNNAGALKSVSTLPPIVSATSTLARPNAISPTIQTDAFSINPDLAMDLTQIQLNINSGFSLKEVLQAWASSRPLSVVVKTTTVLGFGVGNQLGGKRARGIESLAAGLRSDIAMREEIYALSTQARVSGLVIAAMPVVFLALFSLLDRTILFFLFTTPLGIICLFMGLTLDILGAYWMKGIIKNADKST